jgi:hypothetical protein
MKKKITLKQHINQKRFLRKIMWIKEMCLKRTYESKMFKKMRVRKMCLEKKTHG